METLDDLKKLVQVIVAEASVISERYTNESDTPVNYACIFSQSESEYENLLSLARQLGAVVQETAMGPVFHIASISTEAGDVRLLKIRRPDANRPQRGDVDFTLPDYQKFKEAHLGQPGFSLIERKDMEMIELIDPASDVLVYYSHPPLAEVLKL
jgi:hypothetical protein